MNSEQITAFLQEHWYITSVLIGAVILIGAIRNWNWLPATPLVRGMLIDTAEDTGVWFSFCWVFS